MLRGNLCATEFTFSLALAAGSNETPIESCLADPLLSLTVSRLEEQPSYYAQVETGALQVPVAPPKT